MPRHRSRCVGVRNPVTFDVDMRVVSHQVCIVDWALTETDAEEIGQTPNG
jgi:hypothetical protein